MGYLLCSIILVIVGGCFGYVIGWKKATDPEAFKPYVPEKTFKHEK